MVIGFQSSTKLGHAAAQRGAGVPRSVMRCPATGMLLAAALFCCIQTRAQSENPAATHTEAYQSAIARAAEAHGSEFEAQYDHLVKQVEERDKFPAPEARIVVRRDLAAFERERKAFNEAGAHLGAAVEIAEKLGDANWLLPLYLKRAEVLSLAGNRWLATQLAQSAWDLARILQHHQVQVDAGLLLTDLLHRSGHAPEAAPYYAAMRALPDVDQLPILVQEASQSEAGTSRRLDQWREVIALAHARGNPAVEGHAWDVCGFLSARDEDWAKALEAFRRADEVAPDRSRPAYVWETYARTLEAVGDGAGAREILTRAVARLDQGTSRAAAAHLYEARSKLLADHGDPAAAYAALRRAVDLRQPAKSRMMTATTRMVAPTPNHATDEAAALAAARNAMREAELSTARTRQFAAFGIGATALMLAGALAVAYTFKRRAVVALSCARDAAELRAENAQLLALRYQLNPHFLFNAFNHLRARVTARPSDAVGLIDRLTAFCRQTLLRRPEGVGTVADEIAMLSSYLEIEQTRWEDNLRLTRRFDPAARDRLLPSFLLLPLLENALKYGAQTSEETVVVFVAISAVDDSTLEITVRNSGRWIEPGSAPRRTSTGTGLTNLRRRLNRYYPERHRFTISPGDDTVVARLVLHGDPLTTTAPIAS